MTPRPQPSLALLGALLASLAMVVVLAAGAQAQDLPQPSDHLRGAVSRRGGLSDVPGPRAGGGDAGADRCSHRGREQVRRLGRGRARPRVWRGGARRLHAAGQCAGRTCRTCITSRCPTTRVTDFALIGMVTDGPPAWCSIVNGRVALRVGGRADRRRQGETRASSASAPPVPPPRRSSRLMQLNALAGTKIVDVPYRGSGQAAGRRGDGRGAGRPSCSIPMPRPLSDDGKVRALAGPRARGGSRAGRRFPTMAELGFSRLRPSRLRRTRGARQRLPRRSWRSLNKHLNDAINSTSFPPPAWKPLGMTHPDRQHAGEVSPSSCGKKNRAAGRACKAVLAIRRSSRKR